LTDTRALIVQADIITPFGRGIDPCWQALLEKRSAVRPLDRFPVAQFSAAIAATIDGLDYLGDRSLVMQMLERLFVDQQPIPADALLYLATTKGEIDFLEKSMISPACDPAESRPDRLLARVGELTGVLDGGTLVSAACTSSAAAVARGAALIRSGRADCVLVVACDGVTEFIYSGFSSLMALDSQPASPFDRNRKGLSLGEAAAFVLLMGEERAAREGRRSLGEVAGWGMADDANHMTGPSRESEGLIAAIHGALNGAGCRPDDVAFISAHGTGTAYNDAMELGAVRGVFGSVCRPLYSVKGALGHTMGAAGLLEIIIALRSLREGCVPPTVNLREADDAAVGWVAAERAAIRGEGLALVTNAGFSGINTAILLKGGERT
jgi:3-oxoacyl-[acyl-carrier-protein] synthase II